MDYQIREANINDSLILDELLTDLIQDERKYDESINEDFKVNDYYKNYLKNNKLVYVAVNNNNIVGFIDGEIINDPTSYKNARIKALFVKEEYRNNGIASSLINKLMDIFKENNCYKVEISVLTEN